MKQVEQGNQQIPFPPCKGQGFWMSLHPRECSAMLWSCGCGGWDEAGARLPLHPAAGTLLWLSQTRALDTAGVLRGLSGSLSTQCSHNTSLAATVPCGPFTSHPCPVLWGRSRILHGGREQSP